MSKRIECDGCGEELGFDGRKESGPRNLTAAHGQRWVTQLPSGNRLQLDFDLCKACVKVAFDAIGVASETRAS